MSKVPTKHEVLLEYRVAILEGVFEWMLKNGVFVQVLEAGDMKRIHGQATEAVKRRYPNAHVKFTGKFARGAE